MNKKWDIKHVLGTNAFNKKLRINILLKFDDFGQKQNKHENECKQKGFFVFEEMNLKKQTIFVRNNGDYVCF